MLSIDWRPCIVYNFGTVYHSTPHSSGTPYNSGDQTPSASYHSGTKLSQSTKYLSAWVWIHCEFCSYFLFCVWFFYSECSLEMYYTLIDSCVGGAGAGIGPEVDRKWTKLMRGIYKPRVLAPCDFQKNLHGELTYFWKLVYPGPVWAYPVPMPLPHLCLSN